MDAAEKSLLLKLIQGFALSDKDEMPDDKPGIPNYIKEPTEHIEKLLKRKMSIEKKTDFKIEDILIWKDGLKNKRLPEYGQPVIVLKIINPPLEESDPTFSETIDIQLGFITEDDEFLVFNYDSRRFVKK